MKKIMAESSRRIEQIDDGRESLVAYSVHEKPVLIDSCSVEEERGASVCLC